MEDDGELQRIHDDYKSGKMLTGYVPNDTPVVIGWISFLSRAHHSLYLRREVKKILIDLLNDIIAKHQAARSLVTPEVVKAFQSKRKLVFKGQ